MFLSVCFIRYTVLFNRNLICFAVIIILIVSGNKLTLAVFESSCSSPAGRGARCFCSACHRKSTCMDLCICLWHTQWTGLDPTLSTLLDKLERHKNFWCRGSVYIREKELCWQLFCSPAASGTWCSANWRLSGWNGKSRLGLSDEILSWQSWNDNIFKPWIKSSLRSLFSPLFVPIQLISSGC